MQDCLLVECLHICIKQNTSLITSSYFIKVTSVLSIVKSHMKSPFYSLTSGCNYKSVKHDEICVTCVYIKIYTLYTNCLL